MQTVAQTADLQRQFILAQMGICDTTRFFNPNYHAEMHTYAIKG